MASFCVGQINHDFTTLWFCLKLLSQLSEVFQRSVQHNLGLRWFFFTSLSDCSTENFHPLLSQLDGKLKPITTQSPFLAPEPFARIYYEFNMKFAPHNLLFRDYLGLIFDPMSKYALTNV